RARRAAMIDDVADYQRRDAEHRHVSATCSSKIMRRPSGDGQTMTPVCDGLRDLYHARAEQATVDHLRLRDQIEGHLREWYRVRKFVLRSLRSQSPNCPRKIDFAGRDARNVADPLTRHERELQGKRDFIAHHFGPCVPK